MSLKEENENQKIIDSYDYLANAASTTECTGLIPSLPVSRDECKSYEEVYHYIPPRIPAKKIIEKPSEK